MTASVNAGTKAPRSAGVVEPTDDGWLLRNHSLFSRVLLRAVFIGLTLIGAALVSPSPSRPATLAHTVEARPTPVQTVTAAPSGPVTAFGPGMYHVGVDIEPGAYHSAGGRLCYWERLKAPDGTFDAIIANNLGEGPSLVTVNVDEFSGQPAASRREGFEPPTF